MRAIVTGACGFVGRYLIRELAANGYEVLATDLGDEQPPYIIGHVRSGGDRAADPRAIDGITAQLELPADVPYRGCNLLDAEAVAALIGEWRPRAILHLAARSSAGLSFRDPRGTLETNLFGTLNLLEAVRQTADDGEPVRFLSVCSSDVYGRRSRAEMPLAEEGTVEPASPYAVSKAAQEMLSLQYGISYGIDAVVTRSFSHTGPGQTDRFALPAFAMQCAAIKAGLENPTVLVGNLDVVRDYLDVRDVVRAYRALVERGAGGAVYNVCSGRGMGLRDALDSMIEAAGGGISIETEPDRLRPADVPVMIGDNTKIKEDTGWEPVVGSDRMLTDLFAYWEERITAATG